MQARPSSYRSPYFYVTPPLGQESCLYVLGFIPIMFSLAHSRGPMEESWMNPQIGHAEFGTCLLVSNLPEALVRT